MLVCLVGVACLAFGLYAGKRRAKGMSWKAISGELWEKMSGPFRADGAQEGDGVRSDE